MPKILFTRQNAKEMGMRSVASRLARIQAEKDEHLTIVNLVRSNGHEPDTLSTEVLSAFRDTLRSLRNTKDPKERSLLSRSLRDLRETWHLVTGVPKPGVRKLPIERPARLMLSPAVDAGHAQQSSGPASTPPVVEPTSPENP